ncbi:phospholipid carrier-dependent glycosyltransferase [Oscillatoria sp. FACHB-1407]|uniref:dolichyl-phosphate-mannose--protein mannosyltransferase n=1 Tax=Oscillatoria sp. FACHB-1407 TaxID=2692847 RepID=UPI001687CD14|nr:phospholipid carrier-dependent glycosyltransferase [Oscillatoria sp. FACHB-1407]MBD2464535.1 phospholipid carrier-dependent glycosyltransferase [Oscillatoria sp. FACHB-1407]
MSLYPKHDSRLTPWFWVSIAVLFLVAIALRFWGLSRFNTLVFDEVYYAKFATAFLQNRQEFGGHPPLTNYIIAVGIAIAQRFGWGNPADSNDLAGMMLTTFSYRWVNALTGAFIPLVIAAIAYQITHRRSYALIAGLFATLEGMILVESRYALNNVYLILFGLLGHLFVLMAVNHKVRQHTSEESNLPWFLVYLVLAGVGFGASAGIKWNGLGFLLSAYLIWGIAWILHWLRRGRSLSGARSTNPLEKLTQLHIGHVLFGLALVPAVTYYISWIPYIQIDPSTSFWEWQHQVIDYHSRVGGMDAHPYCSPWYSWLYMVRPVAYFYQTTRSMNDPIPVGETVIPQEQAAVVYDVHALGNPFLWWFSSTAILLMVGAVLQQTWTWATVVARQNAKGITVDTTTWLMLYLVLGWAANLLPWMKVSRCTFIYHYMGSSMFALLAIALLCDRWLHSPERWKQGTSITIIFLVIAAFLFWLPLYLGLPLSPAEFRLRQWFPSWV